MTRPRPVVYIAAPYSSDPKTNTVAAIEFAGVLMDHQIAWPIVPHLSHLWNAIAPRPYDDWIALDLALLERCDGLIRLQGDSPGADGEVARAGELELPTLAIDPDDELLVAELVLWAASLTIGGRR